MKYLYIFFFFIGNVHACNVVGNASYHFQYEYDTENDLFFYQIKSDKEIKYVNKATKSGEISNSFSLKKLIAYYANEYSDFISITGTHFIVIKTTIKLENNECLIFETSPIKYKFITKYQHNISTTLDTIMAPIFEGNRSLRQKND